MDQLVDPVEHGERLLIEHGGDEVGVDVTQDRRRPPGRGGPRAARRSIRLQQHVPHRWRKVVDAGPGAADLADEERVAAGPDRDRGGHVGVDRSVGGSEQLRDLLGREAREHDAGASPRQLAEQTVQRVLRLDVGVAVGADDGEVRGARPAGHGPQQLERARVRPVQVVEHDATGRRRPTSSRRSATRLKARKRISSATAAGRVAPSGASPGSRADDLRRHRHGADQRLHRLGPWPERRDAVTLRARPPQHEPAVVARDRSASSASRVLPIPASPATSTSDP